MAAAARDDATATQRRRNDRNAELRRRRIDDRGNARRRRDCAGAGKTSVVASGLRYDAPATTTFYARRDLQLKADCRRSKFFFSQPSRSPSCDSNFFRRFGATSVAKLQGERSSLISQSQNPVFFTSEQNAPGLRFRSRSRPIKRFRTQPRRRDATEDSGERLPTGADRR